MLCTPNQSSLKRTLALVGPSKVPELHIHRLLLLLLLERVNTMLFMCYVAKSVFVNLEQRQVNNPHTICPHIPVNPIKLPCLYKVLDMA